MDDLIVILVRMLVRFLTNGPAGAGAGPSRARPAGATPSRTAQMARPGKPAAPGPLRRPLFGPKGRKGPPPPPAPVRPSPPAAAPIVRNVAPPRPVHSTNLTIGPITAAMLQRQIVLNEILQKPLALRDEG